VAGKVYFKGNATLLEDVLKKRREKWSIIAKYHKNFEKG